MASQFSPIEVDFGSGIEKRTFSKLAEVTEWFAEERKKWDWVAAHDKSERGEVNHAMRQQWQEIQTKIDQLQNTDSSHTGRIESGREALAAAVRHVYAEGRLPYSGSPRGRFLIGLSGRDPEAAVQALALFIHPQVLGNLAPAFHRGVTAALMFETGFETRLDALVGEHVRLGAEAFQRVLDELESARKKIVEEMTFREPVKFWEDRVARHRKAVRSYGVAVALCFIAGAAAVVMVARQFLNSATPEIWRFAAVGAVVTLAVWVSRIFVRILFSHVHLASDAEERAVMMKAYLALVDEGKAIREEDRRYILQALFRSAATGIVKDDSGPETVPDIVARVIHPNH